MEGECESGGVLCVSESEPRRSLHGDTKRGWSLKTGCSQQKHYPLTEWHAISSSLDTEASLFIPLSHRSSIRGEEEQRGSQTREALDGGANIGDTKGRGKLRGPSPVWGKANAKRNLRVRGERPFGRGCKNYAHGSLRNLRVSAWKKFIRAHGRVRVCGAQRSRWMRRVLTNWRNTCPKACWGWGSGCRFVSTADSTSLCNSRMSSIFENRI